MDKFKQLESFVSVSTRGSLTAAAVSEGVAPAIMGRRLDALEARLGVKLLIRTTRRITLTHEGSAFLEDCQRVLADVASGRLVAVLEAFAAPPNGIYAVVPQRKHLPLRVRLWIDFLKHHYGRPGYRQA